MTDASILAEEGWQHPSPRLLAARRLLLAIIGLPVLIAGVVIAAVTGGTVAAVIAAAVILLAVGAAYLVVVRRFRAWGWAEREDDLLVRRGVMLRRLSVVPYGGMQFVDVTAGPIDRLFKLSTVQLHTAAASTDARIPGLSAPEAERLRDTLARLGEARAAGIEVAVEAPTNSLARAESGSWARLHPLSPVVRFGRAAAGVVVLLGSNAVVGENDNGRRITDLVILAIGLVVSITSWAFTRWRLVGTDLQIETGLFRRQSLRLPLTRVQAIDVVRPILARVLGLAEVRVVTAGGGSGKGRLAYMRESQAEQLRAQLLAVAHGLHASTPEPVERPLFTVDNGRLVGSVLLGTPALSFVVLVIGLGAVMVAAGPAAAAGVAGSLVTVGLALGTAIARRFNAEFSQTVGEAPDGLRLRGGLLQTRSETVPFRRLQAMRWAEPALWRPLGWCRLEIDVARQRNRRNAGDDSDNGAVARALMPVGSAFEGASLLHGFMPGVTAASAWAVATLPPRRARWKAPLSYRHLGLWVDERVVVIGSGRLGRAAVVIPLHKAQSFRLEQGPLSRLLGLATVHVDLVGRRWRPAAHGRDAAEARRLIDTLSVLAREARAREAATPAP